MKTRAAPDPGTAWIRPPPIDIRFRVCQGCGWHKPTKGGSIRMGRGKSGGHFLCAECKAKAKAEAG